MYPSVFENRKPVYTLFDKSENAADPPMDALCGNRHRLDIRQPLFVQSGLFTATLVRLGSIKPDPMGAVARHSLL